MLNPQLQRKMVPGLQLEGPTQRRKSVYNFGGTDLKKIGESAAPKARSCNCRRQEAPHNKGV